MLSTKNPASVKLFTKGRVLSLLVTVMVVALVYLNVGPIQAQSRFSHSWPDTDFDQSLIDLSEIRSGGPPKDGIPAVDNPKFISTKEASEWLHPREPVIAVIVSDNARAYPLQILMFHEIVNDEIGDTPLSVTFCPLCNASIVFDRRLKNQVFDFGTTGNLRKSDLVMYDRQTESWWQQFTGGAIVGDMVGEVLTRYPSVILAYNEFVSAHPNGEVLSRDTGYQRPYGNNPYRGYDRIGDQPFLFDEPTDPRLPAMERVINVSVNGKHKIYPFSAFDEQTVINDRVENVDVVIMSSPGTLSALDKGAIADSRTIPSAAAYSRVMDGKTLLFKQSGDTITDSETGSEWNLFGKALSGPMKGKQLDVVDNGVHFAFAWLAFNPESEIYQQ